jgi:pimeloyl-ACP methyl ester carboxylesterase
MLVATVVLAGCGSSRSSPAPTGPPASTSPTPATPALPNGLVDIGGGRSLVISCTGSGGPVVVLDAGLGNALDVWSSVVPMVESFTTVCRYDRAGLGGSDRRPAPHGASNAVDDLHALLAAASLPSPYVVVGASFGGLIAQLFARRYPDEVAGVVLVDALPPDWDAGLEALLSPAQVAERRAIPTDEDMTNEDIRASDAAVLAGPPFPPVPLVVLRHGLPFPGGTDWPTAKVEDLWAKLQDGLSALSPHSTSLLAAESGHRIHQQQPDLVAHAIHAIVDPARWPPTAPAEQPAFGAGAAAVEPGTTPGLLVVAGDDGLRVSRSDGSGAKVVVPADGMLVGEPSLDAEGRLLAYTRRAPIPTSEAPQQEATSEVWIADTVSGARHRVTDDGQIPTLSPDGAFVAFSRQGHTYLAHPDGRGLRDLGEGGCAVWAPDSARLAMCTSEDTVFLLRLADHVREPLATGPGPNDPTAWSPDGRSLALFSTRGGNGDVYLIDVDGTGERRLIEAPGNQLANSWTPAGLLVSSSLPDADANDWFLVDPATGAPGAIDWLHGAPNPIAYAPVG